MTANLKIPDEAICHICGEPMKVVRSGDRASALGLKVAGGEMTTIQCHGYYLTIEDEEVAWDIIRLLDAYHTSRAERDGEETAKQAAEDVCSPTRA